MTDNLEASGGEETTQPLPAGRNSIQAGVAAADTAQRRRAGGQQATEVIDELAQETRRTSLLDRVEQQLRETPHVSRLYFGFSITDDRKIHQAIEQEFNGWLSRQEQKQDGGVTGALVFIAQAATHFLEGPTELLFKALSFFQTLSEDDTTSGRAALIGPLRILHFTELHGVRTSTGWCGFMHPGKAGGGNVIQIDENNSSELCFFAYKKMLVVSLAVRDGNENASSDALQSAYKRAVDGLPTVDEVNMLMGKLAAEYFFTYAEFEKVFVAPFHLKLHSELLWPMPPDLSY